MNLEYFTALHFSVLSSVVCCYWFHCIIYPLYLLLLLQHEDASLKMFDHLVDENNLIPEFEKYNLKDEARHFIKEQIAGCRLEPLDENKNNVRTTFLQEKNFYHIYSKGKGANFKVWQGLKYVFVCLFIHIHTQYDEYPSNLCIFIALQLCFRLRIFSMKVL